MKFEDRSMEAASLRVAEKCGISQETAKKLLLNAQARLEAEALGFRPEATVGSLDFDFTEKAGPGP